MLICECLSVEKEAGKTLKRTKSSGDVAMCRHTSLDCTPSRNLISQRVSHTPERYQRINKSYQWLQNWSANGTIPTGELIGVGFCMAFIPSFIYIVNVHLKANIHYIIICSQRRVSLY